MHQLASHVGKEPPLLLGLHAFGHRSHVQLARTIQDGRHPVSYTHLVDGVVVKLEHDEVLVDIGFKSEGVIPSRELSIRKDADLSLIHI